MAKPTQFFNNTLGGQLHFSTTELAVVAGKPTYTTTQQTALKVSANLVGDVLSMGELPQNANLISFNLVGEQFQGVVAGAVAADDITIQIAVNGDTLHETIEDQLGLAGAFVWTIGDGTNGYDYAFNGVVGSWTVNPDQDDVTMATMVIRRNKGVTRLALPTA